MSGKDIIILTNAKIFQFLHSACRIIGQHALCGKENLIVSEYSSVQDMALKNLDDILECKSEQDIIEVV